MKRLKEIFAGYVTVSEAARYLGRSYSQICRYVRTGRLDAKQGGRVLFISTPSIKAFKHPAIGRPKKEKKSPR